MQCSLGVVQPLATRQPRPELPPESAVVVVCHARLAEVADEDNASVLSPLTGAQTATVTAFDSAFVTSTQGGDGLSTFPSVDAANASFETPKKEEPSDEDAKFRATMKSSLFNLLSACLDRDIPCAFSNWDDGVSFPWTTYDTDHAALLTSNTFFLPL